MKFEISEQLHLHDRTFVVCFLSRSVCLMFTFCEVRLLSNVRPFIEFFIIKRSLVRNGQNNFIVFAVFVDYHRRFDALHDLQVI